jgi:hypothetical protein
MNSVVPFFSNTPDDTHCFQAALKMVLKYFEPVEDFSWDDLDRYTGKEVDKWTWPMAGLTWMRSRGYCVKDIELFSYYDFLKSGEQYLVKEFGEEIAREQITHSRDLAREQAATELFLKTVEVEHRAPDSSEIPNLLKEGWLVICNVNARALNSRSGYVGHFIVITGSGDDEFIFHDPGLPPLESRKVSYKIFEQAWAFPNQTAKNIMAFKRAV